MFLHKGVGLNHRFEEMTLLDKAIANYEGKAKIYFEKLNMVENSPPDIRHKRKQELVAIKKHLEHEKRLMMVAADIQAGLVTYREYGKGAVEGLAGC